MDLTRFGLRRQPFPATPDTSCYYPATGHEQALARLARGLADGEGLLLLTGPPGTGKTLLCHRLLEQANPASSAFVAAARDRAGLLQAVLFDLGLPFEGRPEQELRLALTARLLEAFAAAGPTVLVVDEAQQLGPDALEEVRLLGNLEARAGKAVQVVLSAQPGLLASLRRPELASLRQRLAVRAEVAALGLEEAADYLLHHLRAAGARPGLVTDEAVEALARACGGVPRLLNQAARQALSLADEAGADAVDAEAALEALARLGLGEDEEAGPRLAAADEDEPAPRMPA
jgi:type II secretory pathway predicted ATPase ExeA